MTRNQISWWLWATGTVLIVLSWFDVVSAEIGWCGFAIGMAGSALSWGLLLTRHTSPPAEKPPQAKEEEKNPASDEI